MYRESRVILGRPRLDQTEKKQVGLDVFLLDKDAKTVSNLKVILKVRFIQYTFKEEIDFCKDRWFFLEISVNIFSSKTELVQILLSRRNYSLIPKTLRIVPDKIETSHKCHTWQKLKGDGSSFRFLFEETIFDIKIKLEPQTKKGWKFVVNVDGFRPLIFKHKYAYLFSEEVCIDIFEASLDSYFLFLKGLSKDNPFIDLKNCNR